MKVLADPNRPPRTPRRYLPYAPFVTEPRLELRVTRVLVDGHDETETVVDEAACRINPNRVGDWEAIEVELTLADTRAEIAALSFPGLEASVDWVEFVGRLWCPGTRLRSPVRLTAEGGHLRGSLALRAEDLAGRCSLRAHAIRSLACTADSPHVAQQFAARLVQSPEWVIGSPEDGIASGDAFAVSWVDFHAPDATLPKPERELLPEMPEALCHLAMRPAGPVVLVNRRHPEMLQVLEAKGHRGWRARLRNLLAQQIATQVWRSALQEAWTTLRPSQITDDGPIEWELREDKHWTSQVLARATSELGWRDAEAAHRLLDDFERDERRILRMASLAERLGRVSETSPLQRLVGELTES